jgi:tight adherence protein B
MTLAAALLTVGCVVLAVPVPGVRRLVVGRPSVAGAGGRRAPRTSTLLPVLALLLGPWLALVLAGARSAVLVASGAMVAGTVARLVGSHGRGTAAVRAQASVAEACAVLSANLRVGMVPARALATAADHCTVLREARATLALGGDVTAVWRRQSQRDGFGGLRDLARAWEVGTRSGASLTGTLEQVAAGLSADQALRAVVGSELAAPRATGKVMAALPGLGIGMGYLLGGDPLRWLTDGPAGWICLVAGVVLACAGVLWIETLARRAAAEG